MNRMLIRKDGRRDTIIDKKYRMKRQIGSKAHPGCDRVSVQHTGGQLVAGGPSMSVGVRTALMRLPQVAVFGSDVGVQSLTNDQVAFGLEFLVVVGKQSIVGFGAEFRVYERLYSRPHDRCALYLHVVFESRIT